MRNAERFWDRTAKSYDARTRDADEDAAYTTLVERFGKHLEPHHDVLDFGCGTGVVSLKVARRVHAMHGIDTSERMIELARDRARETGAGNVRFSRLPITDAALEAGSFDVILALNVLHLVTDPGAVLRRARELVKPGGIVVAVTPCAGEAGAFARALLALPARIGLMPSFHKFRPADVPALFHDEGFRVDESTILPGSVPDSFVIARTA